VISVVHVSDNDLEAASKVSTKTIPKLLEEEPQKPPLSKGVTEKRTLRSKDASSRVTSELVRFFPDYEETVFGLPKDPGMYCIRCSAVRKLTLVYRLSDNRFGPLHHRQKAAGSRAVGNQYW